MSEHANQDETLPPSLGFSTRTDVGGEVGTEAAVRDANTPAAPPREVTASGDPATATETTQPESAKVDPGTTLGADAPKLEKLANQLCPNCHTGVLYVTRYDPDAAHEKDQGTALLAGHESGGAYDVECGNCGFSESRAFNPGNLFGK